MLQRNGVLCITVAQLSFYSLAVFGQMHMNLFDRLPAGFAALETRLFVLGALSFVFVFWKVWLVVLFCFLLP